MFSIKYRVITYFLDYVIKTNELSYKTGVSGVKCDVPNQRVTVTGTSLKEEDIVNTVKKTGKTVSVVH